jgi:hypothetical protein
MELVRFFIVAVVVLIFFSLDPGKKDAASDQKPKDDRHVTGDTFQFGNNTPGNSVWMADSLKK